MESLVVLVCVALFAIPVIAIIALVRTSSLRTVLNERYREYEDTVSDLRREISALRRSLADLSARVTLQDTSSAVSSTVESVPTQPLPISGLVETPSPVQATAAKEPPLQVVIKPSEPPPLDLPVPAVSFVEPLQAAETVEPVSFAAAAQSEPAISTQGIPEVIDAASVPPPAPSGHRQTPPLSPPPNFAPFEARPRRKSFTDRLRAALPLED